MPELPEVETVCRGLATVLQDQQIKEIILRRENLRYPFPFLMPERLQQATIVGVRRRAKYILIDLSTKDTWLIHLGMSGKFHLLANPHAAGKHDHLILELSNGICMAYHDPRRFGYMALVPTCHLQESPYLKNLGLEPLEAALSAQKVWSLFNALKRPIKVALLEQKYLVGLGNIYVCESLWAAGISPFRESHSLTLKEWERLLKEIQAVLQRALTAGGSTLKDHKQVNGQTGYFQHQFSVYNCHGRACQKQGCHGTINRITQSGRSTFYCPKCQQ